MDDCNLRKLSLSAGTLDPPFNPSILNYKVTLGNDAVNLTVHPVTSDNHATVVNKVFGTLAFIGYSIEHRSWDIMLRLYKI
eukprot:g32754.t1